MSGIFVDEKELFEVKVYYTISEDSNLMMVYSSEEIDPEAAKEMKSITFKFRLPDWMISRAIMRSCRMHVDGDVLLDIGQLNASLFQYLCVDWDVTNDAGEKMEFSYEKMITVRPDIARCAANGLQAELIRKGIWDSLLES